MRGEQAARDFALARLEVQQEGPGAVQRAEGLEAAFEEGLQLVQPGQLRRQPRGTQQLVHAVLVHRGVERLADADDQRDLVRAQARQLVRHGHVAVDNRKVNIPSYEVSAGEEISIREGSKRLTVLELAKEFASHQNAPNWLEIDRDNYKGRVTALPKREDIQLPVNEQLIVELYSK